MAWYTSWFGTRYYKLLYGHRDEEEARAWVEGLVGHMGLEPGDEVLDMACGRGRHAHWFVHAGMRVTGIDLSSESICEARTTVTGAEFHLHDMRLPFGTARFDAAVCLFTSLGYSGSRDDDRRSLRNVAEALRPGGRFVLDHMNTPRILKDLVADECTEVEGVRFSIRRTLEEGRIVKRIHVLDQGREERFEERLLALSPDDLRTMVQEAGLIITDITCGPPFAPFDAETSERSVILAHKPA